MRCCEQPVRHGRDTPGRGGGGFGIGCGGGDQIGGRLWVKLTKMSTCVSKSVECLAADIAGERASLAVSAADVCVTKCSFWSTWSHMSIFRVECRRGVERRCALPRGVAAPCASDTRSYTPDTETSFHL